MSDIPSSAYFLVHNTSLYRFIVVGQLVELPYGGLKRSSLLDTVYHILFFGTHSITRTQACVYGLFCECHFVYGIRILIWSRDASVIRTRSLYTVYSCHHLTHGVNNCLNRRPLLVFRTHIVNRMRIARRVYRSGRVNLSA